ncbi:unnamed protein product, partial [Ixodes pacificus]
MFGTLNPKTSIWTPLPAKHPETDNSIKACRSILANSSSNLISKYRKATPQEVTALKFLRNRTDLVIKPTDKGGAVVVWCSDLYSEEALRQLSVSDFYEPLSSDPTAALQDKITATVRLLIETNSLHPAANCLIVPRSPGRHILSAISCPTYFIFAFVDSVLQPIVQNLPSYVKDTTSILQRLCNLAPTLDTILFTMDINISLY